MSSADETGPAARVSASVASAGGDVTAPAFTIYTVIICYPLAWFLLFHVSEVHWFLPAGLRLACMWTLGTRRWPALFLAEAGFLAAFTAWREPTSDAVSLAVDAMAPFAVYALAITVVRGWRPRHAAGSDGEVLGMLQAGAVAACLNAVALGMLRPLVVAMPGAAGGNPMLIALGDYLGMLLVAPLLLALARAPHEQASPNRLFATTLIGAVPALLVGLLVVFAPQSHTALLELGAAVGVLFAIAYQTNWVATAYSTTALSATLMMLGGGGPAEASVIATQAVELQAVLAAIGTGALALAVVAAAQRASELHWRELAALEAQQRDVLQEAAIRIISAQERERSRIGRDLHDTLGQTMTATKLRLRAIGGKPAARVSSDDLAEIEGLIAASQAELYGVIRALHPVDVEHYGLTDALRLGSIATMLADADIKLYCHIELPSPLDARIEAGLFRICQEAAQNVAKHSTASRFTIQLNCTQQAKGRQLFLLLGDDAGKITVRSGGRHWLQSIRDRATAMNAEYRFYTEHGEPRHSLMLWLPDNAAAGVQQGAPDPHPAAP